MPSRAEPGEAGHRTAPHTADLIVEAWGPSRTRCLEEAVRGLAATVVHAREGATAHRRPVHVAAGRDDEVLVAVLQEVIYVIDVDGEVPVAAHLAVDDEGDLGGWFEVVDLAEVEATGAVPKGVSRHQLALTESGGTWRCRALIDV